MREILPGGADHVFEAVGHAETMELATRLTGPGGTAVLVGMAPPGADVRFDALTTTVTCSMACRATGAYAP